MKDDDGNTALHLLMFGNTHISQDEVIKLATVIQRVCSVLKDILGEGGRGRERGRERVRGKSEGRG